MKVVRCTFSVSSIKDTRFQLSVKSTKLIDPEGNEYIANLIQFGNKKFSDDWAGISFVENARYQTIIEFPGVPASVSRIIALKGDTGTLNNLNFRDISIK